MPFAMGLRIWGFLPILLLLTTSCALPEWDVFWRAYEDAEEDPEVYLTTTYRIPWYPLETLMDRAGEVVREDWHRRVVHLLEERFPEGSDVDELVAFLEHYRFTCQGDERKIGPIHCKYARCDTERFNIYEFNTGHLDVDIENYQGRVKKIDVKSRLYYQRDVCELE